MDLRKKKTERESTWKLPRIEFVKVNLGDNGDGDRLSGAFPDQVMVHELIIGRVESEPRRHLNLTLHLLFTPFTSSTLSLSI